MNKQLFPCPVLEEEKSNHSWKENNTHLSQEQMQKVEELLRKHPDVPATPSAPLGRFNLFQISADVKTTQDATQHKRKVSFELAQPANERMEKLKIIRRNDSDYIPNIANLVVVSKTERLTKADKFELKKATKTAPNDTTGDRKSPQDTEAKNPPKVTHRVTCDYSTLNTLTTTRKYISMPNIDEIASKIKDCYCTTIDLTDYFSQLELDSASKNMFNFYYKDYVMSYNRAPQGWQSSPFFGVLALKMTFSPDRKSTRLNSSHSSVSRMPSSA